MRFQIHQDRAVVTPFCPGKIVHANHPWNALRGGSLTNETAQQGGATGGELHLCSKTRASLATSNGSHAAEQLCRRLSPTLVASSKRGEIFSKRLARTGSVGTAKAPRLDLQNYSLARTGQALNAAAKPAMCCQCLDLTQGTSVACACRNQSDGDLLALLLD